MRTIRQTTPSAFTAFKALVRSDFLVQMRQRRAFIASLLVPLLFLFVMRRLIPVLGAATVLATCISIGLPAIGLMGYALVVARDRELGVFQRLRATPCPTWVIMSSRFAVQLLVMAAVTVITIVVAYFADDIQIDPGRVVLVLFAAGISGASFLALGQLVVALFKSSETVNAATRLIYMAVVLGGIIGQSQRSASPWHSVVEWSPLGVTKAILQMALVPGTVGWHGAEVVLASVAYTLVFAAVGIRWFKWTVN